MVHLKRVVLFGLALFCLLSLPTVFAQLGGSRAGVAPRSNMAPATGLETLAPEVAQGYITIEGQVELRLEPTEIRIVIAVTAEGSGPAECRRTVNQKIETLTAAWLDTGVPRDNIVEDFIAVLPRYDFEIETVRKREVAVEKLAGFVMQSNLHVAVENDAQAMRTINIAFEVGIADILAFDYWSDQLDAKRAEARTEAVRVARAKSDALLGALFEVPPPLINLQESTRVVYPESLYASFTNANEAIYQSSYGRGNVPEIRTFRPKNTYYRGLYPEADVQSNELPMRSQISVVSTVRLYFESPGAWRRGPEKAPK